MIESFEIENLTTNSKTTIGRTIDNEYLFDDEGIDWGIAEAKHSTYSYPSQVGSYISSTKIGGRDITIVGYVFYILSDSEAEAHNVFNRDEFAYQYIKQKKSKLNALINPNDILRITIGDFFIDGKPNQSVKYGQSEKENNIYFCKFMVSIFCNEPTFKKSTNVQTLVSESNGIFHFPLALKNTSIVMSSRQVTTNVIVENTGDIEIGGKIIIEAHGAVQNPTITNITNGQSFTINKTMQSGEKIIINTEDGNDKGITGEASGVEQSYLKYWSLNNNWIKFPVGTSVITFSSANGTESLLDVLIEVNPKKLALEEM